MIRNIKILLCVSFFIVLTPTEKISANNTSIQSSPTSRNLSDYMCTDGKAPDGKDNDRDDTAALVAALKAGPGIVLIGPGYYRFGNVTIPEKVSVIGSGIATIIRSNGEKSTFNQIGVGQWSLKNLALDGERNKQKADPNNKKQGIYAEGSFAFNISNITAYNFTGAAVEFAGTNLQAAALCNGGTVSNLTLHDNYVGLAFSKRAEYITAVQIKSYHNDIGCIISGGNNTLTASHFCSNDIGILLDHKDNGSHGAVVNCLINHNEKYAILAKNSKHGYNFVGCNIFYAVVKLTNCEGIKIASSNLYCSLIVEGNGSNQIIDNYLIQESTKPFKYELSPSTILQNNFDTNGPWNPTKP